MTIKHSQYLETFGDKTVPRHSVIDGLKRICEVMEYNIEFFISDEV